MSTLVQARFVDGDRAAVAPPSNWDAACVAVLVRVRGITITPEPAAGPWVFAVDEEHARALDKFAVDDFSSVVFSPFSKPAAPRPATAAHVPAAVPQAQSQSPSPASHQHHGEASVLVLSLADSVDAAALQRAFGQCGTVVNARVMYARQTSNNGPKKSRGFGFVKFAEPEEAQRAIVTMNGETLAGKVIEVRQVKSKDELQQHPAPEREPERAPEQLAEPEPTPWPPAGSTNVYVANLDFLINNRDLLDAFSRFGVITSAVVILDEQTKLSRGYGFVNFTRPDEAQRAIGEMDGRQLGSRKLVVRLHETEEERERRRQQTALPRAPVPIVAIEPAAAAVSNPRCNVFVSNLDFAIDNVQLRNAFAPYGTITSAVVKVDRETHLSRGYGFVSFTSPEEAERAIAAMNGRVCGSRAIVVAPWQTKEEHERARCLQPTQATGLPQPQQPFVSQPAQQPPQLFISQHVQPPAERPERPEQPARRHIMTTPVSVVPSHQWQVPQHLQPRLQPAPVHVLLADTQSPQPRRPRPMQRQQCQQRSPMPEPVQQKPEDAPALKATEVVDLRENLLSNLMIKYPDAFIAELRAALEPYTGVRFNYGKSDVNTKRFSLTGPAETVRAARDAFERCLQDIKGRLQEEQWSLKQNLFDFILTERMDVVASVARKFKALVWLTKEPGPAFGEAETFALHIYSATNKEVLQELFKLLKANVRDQ